VASAVSPGVVDGGRLTTIVAVTYDERGVINPCGRCRQTMFDYYPDIEVIVRDGAELKVVRIDELIPHAYRRIKYA
jgi:cytidine deaminase